MWKEVLSGKYASRFDKAGFDASQRGGVEREQNSP
jgi:hypothetical protein